MAHGKSTQEKAIHIRQSVDNSTSIRIPQQKIYQTISRSKIKLYMAHGKSTQEKAIHIRQSVDNSMSILIPQLYILPLENIQDFLRFTFMK